MWEWFRISRFPQATEAKRLYFFNFFCMDMGQASCAEKIKNKQK